jgi:EAL domain-containing protein (putative c-di-GMP-specific phosphodiesterase class I)/ActR/RegA family two-component response regulator
MSIQSIMVVEDSKVQNDFAVGLCKKILPDVEVGSATNGREALLALREKSVSLLVVDLEMPVMDGVELLGFVTAEKLAKSTIVLSSQDNALISAVGTMAEAQGIKVLGTLKKPITEDVLVAALEHFDEIKKEEEKQNQFLPNVDAADLLKGIKQKQFLCHFQPKITTHGILVKGVESLARWDHPELGIIPPSIFIDLAEEAGHINTLTYHLFEIALRNKQIWKQRGLNFGLAFNLSPISLSDPHVVTEVQNLANKFNVNAREITLEVTENALMGDLGLALQALARLRLLGFNLAIDDYGTGFANAEQLSLIPATELKIDRSMVDGAAHKPQLAKILESTVRLAKDLEMATVAEGVEKYEDYRLLAEMNVDMIQGYFFSRPLNPDTLVNWIQSDLKVLRGQICRR